MSFQMKVGIRAKFVATKVENFIAKNVGTSFIFGTSWRFFFFLKKIVKKRRYSTNFRLEKIRQAFIEFFYY